MRKRLNLEPTNHCDRHCAYCADDGTRKRGFLDPILAERILRQFEKLEDLRLFVSGEPLLHPKIVDLVRMGKRYSDTVTINTNCDKLTTALSQKLIKAGLDKMVMSYHKPPRTFR